MEDMLTPQHMVAACIELFPAWNCMAKSAVISAARIIEINNENSKISKTR